MAQELSGPAEGEALRRLIEQWRNIAANSEARGGTSTSICADELEAALDDNQCPSALGAGVRELAQELVDRYTKPHPVAERHGGCGWCGGLPHTGNCLVGRMEAALAPLSGPVDASGEPEQALAKVALSMRREAALWPKTERAQQTARLLNSFAADIESILTAAVPSSPAQERQVGRIDPSQWEIGLPALPPPSPVADPLIANFKCNRCGLDCKVALPPLEDK